MRDWCCVEPWKWVRGTDVKVPEDELSHSLFLISVMDGLSSGSRTSNSRINFWSFLGSWAGIKYWPLTTFFRTSSGALRLRRKQTREERTLSIKRKGGSNHGIENNSTTPDIRFGAHIGVAFRNFRANVVDTAAKGSIKRLERSQVTRTGSWETSSTPESQWTDQNQIKQVFSHPLRVVNFLVSNHDEQFDFGDKIQPLRNLEEDHWWTNHRVVVWIK